MHVCYMYIYIYVFMKAMCPPGYHHNGHMATHALEHMMYGSGYIYIYVCIYIHVCYMYIYIHMYS